MHKGMLRAASLIPLADDVSTMADDVSIRAPAPDSQEMAISLEASSKNGFGGDSESQTMTVSLETS